MMVLMHLKSPLSWTECVFVCGVCTDCCILSVLFVQLLDRVISCMLYFAVLAGRQRKWFSLDEARQHLIRHRPTMCNYLDLLQKPAPTSDDQLPEPVSSSLPPARTATPSWRDICHRCIIPLSSSSSSSSLPPQRQPMLAELATRQDWDFCGTSMSSCNLHRLYVDWFNINTVLWPRDLDLMWWYVTLFSRLVSRLTSMQPSATTTNVTSHLNTILWQLSNSTLDGTVCCLTGIWFQFQYWKS